jgi:hypothetical protein
MPLPIVRADATTDRLACRSSGCVGRRRTIGESALVRQMPDHCSGANQHARARHDNIAMPFALHQPTPPDRRTRIACIEALGKRRDDPSNDVWQLAADLEVPNAQRGPTGGGQVLVDLAVPRDVPRDFLVPIGSRATGAVSRWVAMPERSVDEQSHLQCRPREIGRASDRFVMTSPSANSGSEERPSDFNLRRGVLRPDSRHDAAPLLGCARVGHELRLWLRLC